MSKVIEPLVYDFMVKTSKDIFNAAQSGDVGLAAATLGRTHFLIPHYLQQLTEGKDNGTD